MGGGDGTARRVRGAVAVGAAFAVLGSVLVLMAVRQRATAPAPEPTPPSIEVGRPTTYTTATGMSVVLWEDHRAPSFNLTMRVAVGSADEPAGRGGFAHLFEHLMFTGTAQVPDLDDELHDAGLGDWNAYTDREETVFYESGTSEALNTALWVEADRFTNLASAIDEKDLDLERDVVLNEFRERTLEPPLGAVEVASESYLLPKAHPYHRPVIGSMEDLRAATVDDARAFFLTYYVPSRTTLILTGDFDTAKVRTLIGQLFAHAGSSGTSSQAPTADSLAVARRMPSCTVAPCTTVQRTESAIVAPHVLLEWAVPPPERAGRAATADVAVDVLATILTLGGTSPLERRIVDELGLAESLDVSHVDVLGGTLVTVDADASDGVDPERLATAIRDELEALGRTGFSAQDYEAVRVFRRTLVSDTDADPVELASLTLDLRAATGSYTDLAGYLHQTDHIGNPEVGAAFDRLLGSTSLTMLVTPRDPSDVARYPDVLVQSTGKPAAAQRPAVRRAVRIPRPPADRAPSIVLPEPVIRPLAGGGRLVYFERPGALRTAIAVRLPGGSARDPIGGRGRADLLASMLQEGSGGLASDAFVQRLDLAGAWVDVTSNDTDIEVTMAVGAPDVEARLSPAASSLEAAISDSERRALALLGDVLARPNFDPDRFEIVRSALRQRVQSMATDTDSLAALALGLDRSPRDPNYRAASSASIDAIGLDDLREEWTAVSVPSNALVVAAGPLPGDLFADALDQALAGWTAAAHDVTAKVVAPSPHGLRTVLVDMPGSTQAQIRYVGSAPGSNEVNAYQLDFANDVLVDDLAELREGSGITYGAGAWITIRPRESEVEVSGAFDVAHTGEAVRRIQRIVAGRRDAGGYSDDDASYSRRIERLRVVSDGWDVVYHYLDALDRGVSWDEVVTALTHTSGLSNPVDGDDASLFDGRRATFVIVGDLDRIRQQLKGLELGDVREVEAVALVDGTARW